MINQKQNPAASFEACKIVNTLLSTIFHEGAHIDEGSTDSTHDIKFYIKYRQRFEKYLMSGSNPQDVLSLVQGLFQGGVQSLTSIEELAPKYTV